MTYTWDERGNMKTQTGMSFEWNEDNRLTRVWTSSGDPKQEVTQVHYRYDHAGRRILQRNYNGPRTRHFFNGLTEEVRKVSVGSDTDTAFAFHRQLDAANGVTGFNGTPSITVEDETAGPRFAEVYEMDGWWTSGNGYWSPGTGWDITGKRTMSVWLRDMDETSHANFEVYITTTDSNHYSLCYNTATGSPSGTDRLTIPLGGTDQDFGQGHWVRVERDLQADLEIFHPGKTILRVMGAGGWNTFRLDDLDFSNSMTVEHNTFGSGVIGHILRNRRIDTQTYAATDKWFHYDQVGSVLAETDASGASASIHHPDSYGNRMSSWETGLWGTSWAARAGWGHNTKELMADTGLVYMYQRWYNPETGTFISRAPYPPDVEHSYGFALQNPIRVIDPEGLQPSPAQDLCRKLCVEAHEKCILLAKVAAGAAAVMAATGTYATCCAINRRCRTASSEARCKAAAFAAGAAAFTATYLSAAIVCDNTLANCLARCDNCP